MDKKKILVADDSPRVRDSILSYKEAKNYELAIAENGKDCIELINSFQPDLILLKLMLPKVHSIEIIDHVKSNKLDMGIIICSEKAMIQDYRASIEAGADFYLLKPFKPEEFFRLVKRYFSHTLKPEQFYPKQIVCKTPNDCYNPSIIANNYLKFWGTRGSITVAGAEYNRFGGNTACFEIRLNNELILLDAGTGIRSITSKTIGDEITKIHLFLSHTHWDHIIGLPFFEPLFDPKYEIVIYGPVNFGRNIKELITDMLAYEFFPVRLDEVKAKISFENIRDKTPIKFKDIKIDFHYTFHPGITLCFKVILENKVIGYVTDNEMLMGYHEHPNKIKIDHPLLEPHLSLIEFFKGCDILIHEAQYTPEEYFQKVGWGHSSVPNATILAKYTKTPKWIITHHDPSHNDQFLLEKLSLHKKVIQECEFSTQVQLAYDGFTIPLSS